jgi:hypothetical protein
VAIDTASASRKATFTRIILTAMLVVPVGFVGLSYAANGPLGIPLALPTLYLLWVLGLDTVSLARGGDSCRARPGYKWFLLAGVAVVIMWISLLVAHGAKFG